MGLIIKGNDNISVEARRESFYIQDHNKYLGNLNVIELSYNDIEELENLLMKIKNQPMYKEFKENATKR